MEEFTMTQEAFDRLWARVVGNAGDEAPPRRQPDDAETLRRFLDETALSLRQERQLCVRGGAGDRLRVICRETAERFRMLRTAFFLLTGERYRAPASCSLPRGALTALRQVFLSVKKRAGDYLAAAERTESEELRALYLDLAESEARHADALREVISLLLG